MRLQLRVEMFNVNHTNFNGEPQPTFNQAGRHQSPTALGGSGGRFGFGALPDMDPGAFSSREFYFTPIYCR